MATIGAGGFGKLLDKGADITPHLDKSSKRRPDQERVAASGTQRHLPEIDEPRADRQARQRRALSP